MDETGQGRAFVVGGGIVGVCCALAMRRRGFDVTLIEKDVPGRAASIGNSASIGLASVPPLGTPGMLRELPRMLRDPLHPLVIRWRHLPQTLPWLLRFRRTLAPERVEAIARARADLLAQAGTAWDSLLAEIGRPELIRRTGLIFAYESRAGFEKARGGIALRRRYGIEAQELDAPALRALEPALSGRALCGVHYPVVRTATDPLALTEAIVDALRARGGRVLRGTVTGFETGPEGVRRIVTDAGRHDCELLVIAAGAWSRELLAQLGERVTLIAERGYHVMISDAPYMPAIPVVAGDRNVSIVTLATGLRMTTGAELATVDAPPRPRARAAHLPRRRRHHPGPAGQCRKRVDGIAPVDAGFAAGDRPVETLPQHPLRDRPRPSRGNLRGRDRVHCGHAGARRASQHRPRAVPPRPGVRRVASGVTARFIKNRHPQCGGRTRSRGRSGLGLGNGRSLDCGRSAAHRRQAFACVRQNLSPAGASGVVRWPESGCGLVRLTLAVRARTAQRELHPLCLS
jgi:glycine/D-amino acid oxidase-like deaminating enzyme